MSVNDVRRGIMDWDSSILWGIIGLLGGGIITYLFEKHPISKYKIIYKKETSCLLSNTEMKSIGISVQHDTCNIDNLYFSKVTILNKGYYKITKNDFVETHNIKLFTDGQIFPYDFSINNKNQLVDSNDIKLELKSNKQIDINIILLYPHDSFDFSFFHTDEINYSGELNNGKICEYHNKNYYPLISLLLFFNFIFSILCAEILEIDSNNIIVIKILFELFLMVIFSCFYNT